MWSFNRPAAAHASDGPPGGVSVDLSGEWLHRVDPLDIGEHYAGQLAYTHSLDARWPEPSASTADWTPVAVPGSWPRPEADGDIVWFRRSFRVQEASPRSVLSFEGVNYLADVWMNGHYLGSHEGYFGRFEFDVADVLVVGSGENHLVVRVARAHDVVGQEDQMGQFKKDFVGALGRWDMNDPHHKPAGIWGSVTLKRLGALSLGWSNLDYHVTELPPVEEGDAEVLVRGTLTTRVSATPGSPTDAVIRLSIAPSGFAGSSASSAARVSLRPGGERVATLDFAFPARLWYTWDLGEQRLYDVTVSVLDEANDALDERTWTTGFRTITRGAGWQTSLNGLRFYQRGANHLSNLDLSSMTPERYRTDVALMKSANLNTAHPFCHVEADAFYAECDRQGIAVYQDFPVWLMADTSGDTVRRALAQFDQLLERLREHPSVVIWSFGSQPSEANVEKLCAALVRRARAGDPSRIAHLGNAHISYEAHDDTHPTRSFFWARGAAERFEERYDWRRDTHMYPGWYFGSIEAIEELPLDDFALVTEFGGQALPRRELLERFLDCDGQIDWGTIARHCGQPDLLKRHNPAANSVEELIEHSQRHQSELVRHHVEFIRGRKGAPGNGLHLFAFVDCWPSITWSVLDHDRVPKPAYDALRVAMAPVQAFLPRYRQGVEPGEQALVVSLVNDSGRELGEVRMRVLAKEGRVGPEGETAGRSDSGLSTNRRMPPRR